ncbi:MAG: phospholipase D-like domain-containing protein [Phormidesmis sp.]
MGAFFSRHRRRTLLFALGLSLALGTTVFRIYGASQATLQPLLAPLPQDADIQVFFNQSEANVYTEPYREITRYGDNLEQLVIDAIAQATTTVDLAVQELNLPLIAEALVVAQRRGVQVRVILENDYADATEVEALQILANGQIAQIDDTADGSAGSGLMHHKFMVVDRQQVVTGSANFTYSGIHGDADVLESRGNANVLLKMESDAISQLFTQEFNRMWGDGPGGSLDSQFGLQKAPFVAQSVALPNSTLTLQFSPLSATQPWLQSGNGLIARVLSQSARSIDLALFVFSDQLIANQLERQSETGTKVRALIDPGFVYRDYSEALDMLGVAIPNQRCQMEAGNRPWARPIQSVGMPKLPAGDKLHHKFAVVDDATVIVGSQNWSHAANSNNDETRLVIQNKTVAAHFSREFDRLYQNPLIGPLIGETASLTEKRESARRRCSL